MGADHHTRGLRGGYSRSAVRPGYGGLLLPRVHRRESAMTEFLTTADIAQMIGWSAGAFAVGYIAGKLHLSFRQLAEKL